MAITASAGGITAAIKPRRPSWADMSKHYPAKSVDITTLYNKIIGGSFANQEKVQYLQNTCAVRMSYALLRSEFHLPRTSDKNASKLGDDKKWYWLRVANLREELSARFKGFDEQLNFEMVDPARDYTAKSIEPFQKARRVKAEEFLNTKLRSKNGIIVFDVHGWGDATGHFTLWDGTAMKLAYAPGHDDPSTSAYYPWLTVLDELFSVDFLVQVMKIHFWELK